ncbi:EF-P lysine aminoacylase EpmA [Teredinibacter purpureus]|uniref:EF-P lysine aminoacylase EpmA n=1 Tax=Teredinibacter purpureus TaxID=2731756 RepID=UPI0005F8095A|nr:EF-P lysine aminoacylase EpmA [Teredinibacter purpureus]
MTWQPTASIENLQLRARVLSDIRSFFVEKGVYEVEVPLLSKTTVTDPHIDSLQVHDVCRRGDNAYLQTSPEYFMKRLLAAGSGSIYSMAKAFRKDEAGRHHNPEFTMLEWYRLGLDDRVLAREVVELLQTLKPMVAVRYCTYAEVFEKACGLNPHRVSTQALRALAKERLDIDWQDEDRGVWLDLLFTHLVEPTLGASIVVVFDYPVCQSALARVTLNETGEQIARRFEVYWGGLELANGYWELTDGTEQKARFDSDCDARVALGRAPIAPDNALLEAMSAGMPACAGVALGVDRLMMCLFGAQHIAQVASFTWE